MAIICPTVMPSGDDPHIFRAMMERVGSLASRLQIDLMDGDFAPHRNMAPEKLWWPEGVGADLHVMYRQPGVILSSLIALRPHLILFHAESDGDVLECMGVVKANGIQAGVVLLSETSVSAASQLIERADHVLIFGGQLGEPGQADLVQLDKVAAIRQINPHVEIGWDGGANAETIPSIAAAGVDVINVGAALQRAESPVETYAYLSQLAS